VQTSQILALPTNINGTEMNEAGADWRTDLPEGPNPLNTQQIAVASGDSQAFFFITTDLDSGNDAQNLAADYGLDLRVRFPREGWPSTAGALIIALDELLLDAHGRREYLARLRMLKLPFPIIVLSNDNYLEPPTILQTGLLLAARLDDNVFRALRDGQLDSPADVDDGLSAA
jgi:hypothetical protein